MFLHCVLPAAKHEEKQPGQTRDEPSGPSPPAKPGRLTARGIPESMTEQPPN